MTEVMWMVAATFFAGFAFIAASMVTPGLPTAVVVFLVATGMLGSVGILLSEVSVDD